MGADEEGVELWHPTKIVVTGMKDGKPFRSLMDWDRFDELIERCNQQFAPGMPKTGPELPKPENVIPMRRGWKKAA